MELPLAAALPTHAEAIEMKEALAEDTSPANVTSTAIDSTDIWHIIDSYFEKHTLAEQQISSFNHCLNTLLPAVIDQHPPIKVTIPGMVHEANGGECSLQFTFAFGDLEIQHPMVEDADANSDVTVRTLVPQEARVRNLSYSSSLSLTVQQNVYKIFDDGTTEHVDHKVYNNIFIGKLPIMVRSTKCHLDGIHDDERTALNECCFDQGGYFIVNGMEKVLIAQERMTSNFIYCFKKATTKAAWTAEIRCQRDDMQATSPFSLCLRPSTKGKRGGQIVATIPYLRADVPLYILFRALGVMSDAEVADMIIKDQNDIDMLNALKPSIEEASSDLSQGAALDYIGKRGPTIGAPQSFRIKYAADLLTREFLPHVGHTEGCELQKALFLGNISFRLLTCSLGRDIEDDRDHFGKKRVELSGPLIASSFGQLYRKLMKDLSRTLQRYVENSRTFDLASIVRTLSPISQGLQYQIATGNWGKNRDGGVVRTGVSQVLNRLTYMSALSHIRRLNTPLGREGKMAKPRQLHNTHWGMICPAETPEGQAVGLVKNLALMCMISCGSSAHSVIDLLWNAGMQDLNVLSVDELQASVRVFVNGSWIGCYPEGDELTGLLKDLRRQGAFNPEVSIVYDRFRGEVRVLTDAGRALRPLLIVADDKPVITKEKLFDAVKTNRAWDYLVENGCIEYLDCEEEETALIAMNIDELAKKGTYKSFTHCEIHPSLIFGVCASIIPFPDHNQSPRNVYQSAMGKQAIGVYMTNFNERFDSTAHVLFYPQRPLVETNAMKYIRFQQLPSGVNCIVAIMTYSGYNQEDSLIMSQACIDRGLFRSMFFRTYVAEEKLKGSVLVEKFEKPNAATCSGLKRGDYSKLDVDGFAEIGSAMLGDDIIIGKTIPLSNEDMQATKKTKVDASTILRSSENGVVENVIFSVNGRGFRFAKVKLRCIRIPQIGDKFASRHGQKGTIGITYRQEEMPFNISGITPDIIMNPHAIPSRMTIGHLIECLMGKYRAIAGGIGDATPFCGQSVSEVAESLKSLGYQRYGNERLYNGFNGLPISNMIYFGPTYYQRLKHMVDDKIHSRARGPITALTRQPMEGRSREGGLRFGEMERDCMIAHGAAKMLKERLFDHSDAYRVHVCDNCGLFAVADLTHNHYSCTGCTENQRISQICIPYACKLLFQELMGLQIYPKLVLQVA